MSAAAVQDALAVKILLEVPDLKAVYGDGSTDNRVSAWPQQVVTMPSALVKRGETERELRLSREKYVRRFEVDFYLPVVKPADAVRVVNRIDDALRVAFRTNLSLGLLVDFVRFLGSGEPAYREEGEDEGSVGYIVWPTRFETEERFAAELSVT